MKRYIRSAIVNIEDESEDTRWGLAEDPNLRPDTLRKIASLLSDRSPWGAYCAVIQNPNTPIDVLEMLAQRHSSDSQLLMEIVSSPNVTPELLRWIFDCCSPRSGVSGVIDCLAANPKTPSDILSKISTVSNTHTLSLCANNPNMPNGEALSRKLRSSSDDFVRAEFASATRDPEMLDILAYDSSAYVRNRVARNKNTPADVLALLAQDIFVGVREAIPSNPNVTPDILTMMSEDSDPHVRSRVSWSPKTPMSVLEKLAEDEDGAVRDYAQREIYERSRS